MSGFEISWFKNTPTSETVGNGLCAVPGTLRVELVRLNGTTQCSGDDSSPSHVPNITCVVERYHPPTCHPDRNEMEWRDLPKWQILPYVGNFCNLSGFLHSACAAVNDIRFRFGRNKFRCPTIPAYAGWRQIAAATPASYNGTPNVAAMIHRHDNVTNTTRADEQNHLPICHSGL